MKKTAVILSALVLMAGAACKKTGEGEFQVQYPEVDVKKDSATIQTPTVDIVKDTVTVPKVRVKKPKP